MKHSKSQRYSTDQLITLVVPTNRPYPEVEKSLKNVKRASKEKGFKLIVSDNSGDEEKTKSALEIFESEYINSPFNEAIGNWSYGLGHVDTPFVGFMADDDWLLTLPSTLPDTLPEDYVGISPVMLISSPDRGIIGTRSYSLIQSDIEQRLTEFDKQSSGLNALLYGYWQTELFQNIFEVNETHPCPAGYQDWVMVTAMVAEGKIMPTEAVMYNYKNDNWFGPKPLIDQEFERLLVRSDLPSALVEHQVELRVIDLVCFFGRAKGYRLTEEERLNVLDNRLKQLFKSYSRPILKDLITICLGAVGKVSKDAQKRYFHYMQANLTGTSLESSL